MAIIQGRITVGGINVLCVTSDPSLSSGTAAPTGSYAFVNDGIGIFYKQSSSDTDWKQVSIDTVATNRQTDSYILALTDKNKLVEMNKGTANNLTVPPDTDVAFPVGTQVLISQYGAGQTSVVAGVGVTIRSAGGALKLAAQYAGGSLVKIATDEWYLFGNITV